MEGDNQDNYIITYRAFRRNRRDKNFLKCMYIYGLVLNNNTQELVEMANTNNGILFNLETHEGVDNISFHAFALHEACKNKNKIIADIIINSALQIQYYDIWSLIYQMVSDDDIGAFDFWLTSYPDAFPSIYKISEIYEFPLAYEILYNKFIKNPDYNIPNDPMFRERIFYSLRLFSNVMLDDIYDNISILEDFVNIGYPKVLSNIELDTDFYSIEEMLFVLLRGPNNEIENEDEVIELITSWREAKKIYGSEYTEMLKYIFSLVNAHLSINNISMLPLEQTIRHLLATTKETDERSELRSVWGKQ